MPLVRLALLLLVGCTPRSAGPSGGPKSAPAQHEPSLTGAANRTTQPEHPMRPAPQLSVATHVQEDGQIALTLTNRDRAPVSLRSALTILREQVDGPDAPFPMSGVSLRNSCTEPPPECLTLVPGAELHPPPWRAAAGKPQCGCTDCKPAPAGRYRVALQACDGSYRVTGPGFDLSQSRTQGAAM